MLVPLLKKKKLILPWSTCSKTLFLFYFATKIIKSLPFSNIYFQMTITNAASTTAISELAWTKIAWGKWKNSTSSEKELIFAQVFSLQRCRVKILIYYHKFWCVFALRVFKGTIVRYVSFMVIFEYKWKFFTLR